MHYKCYHTLAEYTGNITIYDPWASKERVKREYGIDIVNKLNSGEKYDAVILGVAHRQFSDMDIKGLVKEGGVIYDVKGVLDRTIVDGRL